MSNHDQGPAKQSKINRLTLVGGLILLLLSLTIAGWYVLNSVNRSSSLAVSETVASPEQASMEAEAEESPHDAPEGVPEGVPEESAPGTPTPSFMDDFEDGLDPVWTVLYGDPFVSEGRLTSNVGAGLAAGDSSWENYQIEFEVDTTQIGCPFLDTSNSIGVRVTDFDHGYWFVFTDCQAGWSLFAGGVDQGIPKFFADTAVDTAQGAKHILIEVDEAGLSAYENGSSLTSIDDSRFKTGGVFLQVEAKTFFDNFRVTLLP